MTPPANSLPVRRCFLFKPDGIGDFFLASGFVRLMAREFGEENLTIAVLPPLESVVRGQYPKASVVLLPIRKRRIILNVFVANCLRCFSPWLTLLSTRADVSISLRHMRDYLQNVLFYSVRAKRRVVASNLLLGNGRAVRRWTEKAFTSLFGPTVIAYPESEEGIPSELAANRLIASAALEREVGIGEIWPELRPYAPPQLGSPYWVCAPFSSTTGKDFPVTRWIEVLASMERMGRLPSLVLTGSVDQAERLQEFLQLWQQASPGGKEDAQVILPPSLQDLIDLLAGAECVLTVDTAAAHAATALDCRTLVLFSGLHQGMFAPWVRSSRQRWMLPKSSPEQKPGQVQGSWHSAHEISDICGVLEEILAV
jgi:hypothetical protein